jgi:hypothetical protein
MDERQNSITVLSGVLDFGNACPQHLLLIVAYFENSF